MANDREPTIDAFEIARSGEVVEGDIELRRLPRLKPSLTDDAGSLHYRIEGGFDEQGHAGAALRIHGALQLVCQRCGLPLEYALNRTTRFRFARSETELESWPIDNDEPDAVVGSHAMPILPWIEDEAILSLPLVPRHEDCAGPSAASATEEIESRQPFGVLADWFDRSRDSPALDDDLRRDDASQPEDDVPPRN